MFYRFQRGCSPEDQNHSPKDQRDCSPEDQKYSLKDQRHSLKDQGTAHQRTRYMHRSMYMKGKREKEIPLTINKVIHLGRFMVQLCTYCVLSVPEGLLTRGPETFTEGPEGLLTRDQIYSLKDQRDCSPEDQIYSLKDQIHSLKDQRDCSSKDQRDS